MAIIKRQREFEEKESMDLATSLMLLSGGTQQEKITKPLQKISTYNNAPILEFECKTCNRKFSSFQALGGHRASHKKPKLEGNGSRALSVFPSSPQQPKMHECSICGMEFSLGQALGGHMRRHRDINNKGGGHVINNEGFFHSSINQVIEKAPVPVLKRSNSKRVMSLELDLNLTPLENDLKLLFGNKAPRVDLSLF